MDYLLLSDCLWYMGHILTGMSIFFSRNNYYLAVALVVFGQSITIISRPIGRIPNKPLEKSYNHDEGYHNKEEVFYNL